MINRRGPNTDPWGTRSETAEHPDLWFRSWINCLSVRYDVNQECAKPVTPMSAWRSRSSVWEIVSKAVLSSRRMRMVINQPVSCIEEVVGDFNQGGFSAVMRAEARLEGFVEVVYSEVGLKLGKSSHFYPVKILKGYTGHAFISLRLDYRNALYAGNSQASLSRLQLVQNAAG